MNSIMSSDEWNSPDLSDCDVKGMGGEEGSGCKKKGGVSSAEGFDLNSFFGGSTGYGVSDPGDN